MIRAGRIDDKVEMKDPSEDDGIKMLKQFCADNPKLKLLMTVLRKRHMISIYKNAKK